MENADQERARAQAQAQAQAQTAESLQDYNAASLPARQTIGSRHQPQQSQQPYSTSHSGTTTMDMNNMASALPEYDYRIPTQQLYSQQLSAAGTNNTMMYPYPASQYSSGSPSNYTMHFGQQMPVQQFPAQRLYGSFPVNSSTAGLANQYPGQMFYPSNMMTHSSAQGQFPQFQQNNAFAQVQSAMYAARGGAQQQQLVQSYGAGIVAQPYQQNETQDQRVTSSSSPLHISTTLRGPPRKPKQSGHALWVGNLPPGTNILDLKDHFSREATSDIESVFLISKSNCAFVNYKTEQSCTAAMNRFHDSRFLGVRLVCRLRRGSAPGVGSTTTTPTGPSAGAVPNPRANMEASLPDAVSIPQSVQSEKDVEGNVQSKVKERYYIIKSLTIDDLERSVHTGIWATQSHNEVVLNKAYMTAENVYLIFSANKSGEYFGYARMDSPIDDEAAAAIDSSAMELNPPQPPESSSPSDVPLHIPTAATATAPQGHIIDDSARGTIFWEAEYVRSKDEASDTSSIPLNVESSDFPTEALSRSMSSSPAKTTPPQNSTFGKPFKITWISTERLPFYRTRGLRNPWNTNREVKIARDGTELEPSVGRKLVGMFGTNAGVGSQRSPQPGQYPGTGGLGHHILNPDGSNVGQAPAYRPY